MFINLGPSFSYSSILMTDSLTVWLMCYSHSCSKTLETTRFWPAVMEQSARLLFTNNSYTSEITFFGRMS